jgi:tetratricopeptide (TPR) repeat protein
MKLKFLVILSFLVSMTMLAEAQKSEAAKNASDDAKALFKEQDYENALQTFQKAIEKEQKEDDADINFLGRCEENLAYCYFQLKDYRNSYFQFKKAQQNYLLVDNTERLKIVLNMLYSIRLFIRHYDVDIPPDEDIPYEKVYVFYSVDSIVTRNADTVWVYTKAGSNDNIYIKHNAFVISVYDAEDVDRGNNTLGKGKVVNMGSNSSVFAIVVTNPEDERMWPRKGDILQITCLVPEIKRESVFRDLVSYNIIFKDVGGGIFYDKQDILLETGTQLEDDLIDLFVEDLHETYNRLKDYDEPSFHEILEGGRFKGSSLIESLGEATAADVRAFLNFVRSYPVKYMGKSWNVNETFATWVLSNTLLAEYDPGILYKLEELQDSALQEYMQDVSYYVDDSSFYHWNQYLGELFQDDKKEEAYSLLEKCLQISRLKNDSHYIAVFLNSKAFFLSADEKPEEAISVLTEALTYDAENVDIWYQRGNIYASVDKYAEAIQDHQKVSRLIPDVAAAWVIRAGI